MKILIVIDMQNDFLTGALGFPKAEKVIANVVQKIESENWDEIYYTLDTHEDETYASSAEGAAIPPHCIKGTTGWELAPAVGRAICKWAEKQGRLMPEGIEKPTFGSTLLPMFFSSYEPADTTVEFVGVCTDICVISNVLFLKAAYPEFRYRVDSRCCAGTSEEKHRAALAVMQSCLVEVV